MQHSTPSPTTERAHRTRRPSFKVLEGAEFARGSLKWKRRLGLVQPRKTATRMEVVVPTLRQVDARRGHAGERAVRERDSQEHSPSPQIKSEEEDVKMYCLLQARIKAEVKSEETNLSENIVRDRLALIGHDTLDIKIPRKLLEATTTRRVTSRIWGGCTHAMFPKIGREFTHGHDFMYACLLYDPHVPRWPGSPGLIFKFQDDGQEWPKIMRLIVRLRNNTWQYMGQYKLSAAPPLTPDEWNAQSLQVRRRWATRLARRRFDRSLKAKIVLRKRLGRDPTPQEVATARALAGKRLRASADEILQACDEGRAAVCVWYMKCVGYDVDFQRRIAGGS